MKAKYLVSMLALPALLAACVNDDFETQKSPSIIDNDLLKGRETGEVVLKATKAVVGDDAQTRIVGGMTETGGIEWKWEGKDDKIGAVVVNLNPADYNEIVSYEQNRGYALTNYPFAPDIDAPSAGANFSTPTAVVKGAYVFYNRYDGDTEEGVSRRVIGHGIKEYINVEDGYEAGLQQVGTAKGIGQNFFISPIVDLAVKDGEQLELPVVMKSLYHVLNFNLTAKIEDDKYYDKDGNFKIYKVEVEPANSNDKFYRSFVLDPAKLAKVQEEIANANPGKPFMTNGVIEATGKNNEDVFDAMMDVWNKLSDPTTEIGEFTDPSDKLIYQMANPATFKKSNKDEIINLMIVLPAGVYAKNTSAELRDGNEYGCLKITMYTSEGVYKCYAGSGDSFTARRGMISNVSRELRIGGGTTNVDLFDFTGEGFDVKTKEDWNYAIEYINNQYRDFGTGSTWQAPKLNLSNYDGKDIEVDAEHYFPNFRVIYRGNATLKLVGQKEFSINPNNVILGNGSDAETARPTIKIEDAEATVKFEGDVKEDASKGSDGEDYTAAVKLISSATINIAEDQEVNFEKLISNTALYIAKGATVEVENVQNETTTTDGTVTLASGTEDKAGATFNVKGNYKNNGTLTIGKLASVNQPNSVNTENNGEIIVDGELNVDWLINNAGGTLTVKAWGVEMDNKMSGKATIPTLTNNGSILLEARKQDASGTYGGELVVASKLDNRADITVQGRLEVENMDNTGVVTLSEGEYKYAWIQIKQGQSKDNGKIVLKNPADYEFYDRYFSGEQNLSDVDGVIEAELDAATYTKVLANLNNSDLGNQERAWDVINKVIVKGELPLEAEMGAENKNFVLHDDASINAQEALTLASLTVEGTAAVNAKNDDTKVTVESLVDVKKGANLTIEKNVDMVISYNAVANVLSIAGSLTNEGWIDTEESLSGTPNRLNAGVTGRLVNKGQLSQPYTFKYNEDVYGVMTDLVKKLWNQDNFIGTYAGNMPRLDFIDPSTGKWSDKTTWEGYKTGRVSDLQNQYFIEMFSTGKLEMIPDANNGLYQAVVVNATSGWKAAFYLGGGQSEEVLSEAEWNAIKDGGKDYIEAAMDAYGVAGNMPKIGKTLFYVTDFPAGASIDLSEGVAYGELVPEYKGTITGSFSNPEK